MSKLPVTTPSATARKPRALRNRDEGEIVEANPSPAFAPLPFFSFSYTRTEITTAGGRAQVKAKRSTFADGRLTNESFEGDLDRSAYERAVDQAWQQAMAPANALLQAMSMFLPRTAKRRDE